MKAPRGSTNSACFSEVLCWTCYADKGADVQVLGNVVNVYYTCCSKEVEPCTEKRIPENMCTQKEVECRIRVDTRCGSE